MTPLLVVDGANVVGSVPDGWWRDRAGAAERLRDTLARLDRPDHPEIILVVEGAARGLASVEGVEVVSAPGSGDDMIVEVVRDRGAGRHCTVATADRELIERIAALGAAVVGPRSVRST
jgi:rRNA-processing protein FCF1